MADDVDPAASDHNDAPSLPPQAEPQPMAPSTPAAPRLAAAADPPVEAQPPVIGRARVVEAPEPLPMRRSGWVRALYATAVLTYGPVQIVAVLASGVGEELTTEASAVTIGVTAFLFVAVVLWTWVNIDNCRRLLVHSRHGTSVSPWRGVFWWFAIALVGLPLLGVVIYVIREYVDPSDVYGGDADVIRAFMVLGWLLIMLVLWIRPYLYLGHVMRRINGDASLFNRWIWTPILTSMLSAFGVVFLSLVGALQGDTTKAVFGAAVVGLAVLPYVVWCWAGWKALATMDQTIRARASRQREQRDQFLQLEGSAASMTL